MMSTTFSSYVHFFYFFLLVLRGRAGHSGVLTSILDIRSWLKKTGISRAELAENLLVTKQTVDRWLTGKGPIPAQKLEAIKKMMRGEAEPLPLPPDFEDFVRAEAEKLHKTVDEVIISIIKKAMRKSKDEGLLDLIEATLGDDEQPSKDVSPAFPSAASLAPSGVAEDDKGPEEIEEEPSILIQQVTLPEIMLVGQVSAGEFMWPEEVQPRPVFDKDMLAFRVFGSIMEPEILDGQIVIVKPLPEEDELERYLGDIIVCRDEAQGLSIKRLVKSGTALALAPVNPRYKAIKPLVGQILGRLAGKITL